MSILDPVTAAPPAMVPAPPDSRSEDLRSLLQKAAMIILEDRIMDPEEMAAVTEFVTVLQTAMQGRMAGGQQPNMMQSAMQQQPGGQPPPANTEDYGAHFGQPKGAF